MSLAKQAKTLTEKRVKLVLTHLATTRDAKRNAVIFLLSVDAGLRSKEIASVEWKMYRPHRPQVHWMAMGAKVYFAKRRLKPGVFHSLVDLQAAIKRFVAETNENPKPFTWTADPDKIIAAVKRGQQVLDSFH
jgi:integrase